MAQCRYFPPDKKIPLDFYKSIGSRQNYEVNVKFWTNDNYGLKYLTEEELNNFLINFKELNLFDNFKSFESGGWLDDKFKYIDKLSSCRFEVQYMDGNVDKFNLVNNFPEKWIEFGNLLEDLVCFDVLNIENQKYLITELHFDIENDGVYLDGNKLNLTKLYYYRGGIYGSRTYDYSIDLKNKSINYPKFSIYEFPEEKIARNLTDDQVSIILDLIEKCGVYKWYHKDYLNRLNSYDYPRVMFDGLHWYIELIFEDIYVLHLGGHSEYPDTYRYFASQIKDLLDEDFFELKLISEDDLDDYKFWESKLIE
jgi:hypothetical protein